MKEIVINRCFGGFSLSPLALFEIEEYDGQEWVSEVHNNWS